MKLMDMALIGGLAYLVLTKTAGASGQPSTPTPTQEYPVMTNLTPSEWIGQTKSYEAEQIAKDTLPKYSDFSQFVSHIKDTIQAAGFSRPSISVPLSMQYDNKITSQLLMPVFDARVALTNRMKSYWLSGGHAPAEMNAALDAIKQLEGNVRREISTYYKTGEWS